MPFIDDEQPASQIPGLKTKSGDAARHSRDGEPRGTAETPQEIETSNSQTLTVSEEAERRQSIRTTNDAIPPDTVAAHALDDTLVRLANLQAAIVRRGDRLRDVEAENERLSAQLNEQEDIHRRRSAIFRDQIENLERRNRDQDNHINQLLLENAALNSELVYEHLRHQAAIEERVRLHEVQLGCLQNMLDLKASDCHRYREETHELRAQNQSMFERLIEWGDELGRLSQENDEQAEEVARLDRRLIEVTRIEPDGTKPECPICTEKIESEANRRACRAHCYVSFHDECARAWASNLATSSQVVRCPQCRSPWYL